MDPMKGPVIRKPSTQGKKHRWDFENKTEVVIADFHINTNQTYYIDPEMRGIKITSPDGSTVYFSDDSFADTTTKDFTLTTQIPTGAKFKIVITFDKEFEDSESIEISPSDADGAIIEGPKSEERVASAVSSDSGELGMIDADKPTIAVVHKNLLNDLSQTMQLGVRLARYESKLGFISISLITAVMISSVFFFQYSGDRPLISEHLFFIFLLLTAAIGIFSVLLVKKLTQSRMQKLGTYIENQNLKINKLDFSKEG